MKFLYTFAILIALSLFSFTAKAQIQYPVVEITSPQNYETVARNTLVTIQVRTSEQIDTWFVHCYIDGKFLNYDFTPPYECEWIPTKRKDYNVWARAIDRSGVTWPSQAHLVRVR